MDGPEQVFLDKRVVARMADQPTEGADEVMYIRSDIVQDMVLSKNPAEFFIQIHQSSDGPLVGLTNYGMLWKHNGHGNWVPIPVPELTEPRPENYP